MSIFKRGSIYRFPENKRASENALYEQIEKCQEEVDELRSSYYFEEGDERIIEEAVDLMVAAEGILRKFDERKVKVGMARVKLKNAQRGDW